MADNGTHSTSVGLLLDNVNSDVRFQIENLVQVESYKFDFEHPVQHSGRPYGNSRGVIVKITISNPTNHIIRTTLYDRINEMKSSSFSIIVDPKKEENGYIAMPGQCFIIQGFVLKLTETLLQNEDNQHMPIEIELLANSIAIHKDDREPVCLNFAS